MRPPKVCLPPLPIRMTGHATRRSRARVGLNSLTTLEAIEHGRERATWRHRTKAHPEHWRVLVHGRKGKGLAVIVEEAGDLVVLTVLAA